MKNGELKKQLKCNSPGKLISKYMNGKIFLTEKQLQECIDLKKGTSEENRGSAVFRYRKKEK